MTSPERLQRELIEAETMHHPNLTRVRRILRVGRKARKLAVSFAALGIHQVACGEKEAARRFAMVSQRMSRFADEVRDRARGALRQARGGVGFAVDPPRDAYPRWRSPRTGA